MSTAPSHRESAHPTPATYVTIAIILAVITLVEVAAVFVEALGAVLIPILLVLSATKFAIVAMYFMHLKFDSKLFSGLFVGGILLTSGILLALLALFDVFVS
jgi:caa(3)-type oxidase subunit IV